MRIKIKHITTTDIEKTITVCGWIKTARASKNVSFIDVNDGSQFKGIQVVIESTLKNYEALVKDLTTGASVSVTGILVQSPGKEQAFELKATEVAVIGRCDPETYPLQKKQHSFEFLRTIAHLRSRTNTIGAVARVRNALAYATHKFFQERGFLYLHTPIITGSDCEGAGQMFRVTTLDMDKPPRTPDGKVDFKQDFFGKSTYLTVSGQLNGETYACGLSDIYTFGPTFRAENSNTARHLAEFWMIEPEMAFATLKEDMECGEAYLKYAIKFALDTCQQDMDFFENQIAKGILQKLKHVVETPFQVLTYTEAIELLKKASKKFEYPVSWGADLQSEHERYLAEEYFKKPVILINYPKEIKAFYMHENEDGKTVAAMDILVAGVGEIIGGSQREERFDVLEAKIKRMGLNVEDYWWYLDLRKYGTVPHAGFGLGFERLIRFVTGMENIRDVIPFPRAPQQADF
jgi:asparaginyl-tRNA synthetase